MNSVLSIASGGKWESVSPTKDCDIPSRNTVRTELPAALDREVADRAIAAVREFDSRCGASVALARELGLRAKEACTIDASRALREAQNRSAVEITNGTKGGHTRTVEIRNERQIEALAYAAKAQGRESSLIPREHSWLQHLTGAWREARDIVRAETGERIHDLRAAYACERYVEITGHQPPA